MNKTKDFLKFRVRAVDLQSEWERCSLIANYVGQSTSYEFTQSEYAENLIATVVNEVLETITTLATKDSDISLIINPNNAALGVSICFTCKDDLKSEFIALIKETKQSSETIYFDLLTQANEQKHQFNQLGIAMLIHDFGATLSVSPSTDDEKQLCLLIQIAEQEFVV